MKRLTNVDSVKVLSISQSGDIATRQRRLLSIVECEAEVTDKGGQTEALTARIGTLELLEGAAWLLEKKMAAALDPFENIVPPPVFPYRIAQAAVEYAVPGIDDEGVLACILAALQSSDAPGGFAELLSAAQQAGLQPPDAPAHFRTQAECAIAQNKAALEAQLSALESEFANDGVMAKAIRHIIRRARRGLAERERDQFFELGMIVALQTGTQTPDQMLRSFCPAPSYKGIRGPQIRCSGISCYPLTLPPISLMRT